MTSDDLATAIFGAWDGCISVLALLIAARGSHLPALQAAGVGCAVGGTFSMATGQYEEMTGTTAQRLRLSLIMGVFTLLGGLLPAAWFLFAAKPVAYVGALLAAWGLATLVWVLKKEGLVGAARTYALLVITVVATVVVSLVVG